MVELLGFASRWWRCGGVIQVSAFQLQRLWSFWCSHCRSSLLHVIIVVVFQTSSNATAIRSGLGQGDKSFGRNLLRHVSAYAAFSAQFRSSSSDDRIFRLPKFKTDQTQRSKISRQGPDSGTNSLLAASDIQSPVSVLRSLLMKWYFFETVSVIQSVFKYYAPTVFLN